MLRTEPVSSKHVGKRDGIVDALRARLVSGELAPGKRLPTRAELQVEFDAGAHTVQAAMNELLREGFIETRGVLGTFVSQNPPHLSRYGFCLPAQHAASIESRFCTTLRGAAQRLPGSPSLRKVFYPCVDCNRDNEEFSRLVREVRKKTLAGLIFGHSSYWLAGAPALEESGIPRAAVMAAPCIPGVSAIYVDRLSFSRRAGEYLLSRGRRRVAMIYCTCGPDGQAEEFAAGVPEHSLRPHWVQYADPYDPSCAAGIAHLLMKADPRDAPDGLIVTDDNLVDGVCTGLMAAGTRVPEDLEVVAYANYPCEELGLPGIQRLGFDCDQIIRTCVENIAMQRRGGTPPSFTAVPALFGEEYIRRQSILAQKTQPDHPSVAKEDES